MSPAETAAKGKAAERGETVSDVLRRALERYVAADVVAAWGELRAHPTLLWVPPMWRTADPTTEPNRHAISALDRNLNVDILLVGTHSLEVRLATGPLKDRRVGDGLDPLTPVASIAPELTVSASSFEQAVLELRDAVVKNYGPASGNHEHF